MMNNNKILTVSYGTFSCTLEGFDDSFDTMKAISEYFRDLASDDRYFGAEPPQPDAEMLARIAEREVSRRVEAREHEGRILLKAHNATATPGAVAIARATPAAETVKEKDEANSARVDEEPVVPEIETVSSTVDQSVANENTVEIPTTPAAKETSTPNQNAPEAEKKIAPQVSSVDASLENALGQTHHKVETPVQATETGDDESKELSAGLTPEVQTESKWADESTDVAAFFAKKTTKTYDDEYDENDTVDEVESSSIRTEVVDFPGSSIGSDTHVEAEDLVAEHVVCPQKTIVNESFVEKLQRIRAVVSKQEEERAVTKYNEDSQEPAATPNFEESEGEDSNIFKTDPTDEVVAEATQVIPSTLDHENTPERHENLADSVGGEADNLDAILNFVAVTSDNAQSVIDVDRVTTLAADFDTSEELPGSLLEQQDQDVHTDGFVDGSGEDSGAASVAEKSDLEAYVDESKLDAPVLSIEKEEELLRDLAAVEEETTVPTSPVVGAKNDLSSIDEEIGDDVSRLMAEADQHMREPEGKSRRSAFAHLRAAVSVRSADCSMEEEEEKKVENVAEAYRSDLAEIIKPRRPAASTSQRSERPGDARPAPLKLVAEQRIDTHDAARRGPVTPRRVAADVAAEADETEEKDFAVYAEDRGAASLPELLEAAAAYLSYVEGHEQFSRPQLMSRVRQADCGEFSREEGLRSFGQLLRSGKIEKIKGGRFTASEAISYKPGHCATG